MTVVQLHVKVGCRPVDNPHAILAAALGHGRWFRLRERSYIMTGTDESPPWLHPEPSAMASTKPVETVSWDVVEPGILMMLDPNQEPVHQDGRSWYLYDGGRVRVPRWALTDEDPPAFEVTW